MDWVGGELLDGLFFEVLLGELPLDLLEFLDELLEGEVIDDFL